MSENVNLETGLRGVPVGYCNTSFVDPQEGLHYKGYPISELAYKEPEEVIYLLLHGSLPSDHQLKAFRQNLSSKMNLNSKIHENIKNFPPNLDPMDKLLMGIMSASAYCKTGDWYEDAISLIAVIPEIVASIYCQSEGILFRLPEKNLDYMENFIHMLGKEKKEETVFFMKAFNILHMDHGGGNLSTFVGKAIASGHADIFQSICGSMAALAGPLHGKANRECFHFIKKTAEEIENIDDEEQVYQYVKGLFEKGKKVYGFGHAVLRVEDPRATIQYKIGEKYAMKDEYFRLAKQLRTAGTRYLSQIEKISNPYPNVDAVSGTLLNFFDIMDERYYTSLFAMSRCIGVAIQIVYERTEAKNGKGTPIIRPKYLYNGPTQN